MKTVEIVDAPLECGHSVLAKRFRRGFTWIYEDPLPECPYCEAIFSSVGTENAE